jgi:hypothetical protein
MINSQKGFLADVSALETIYETTTIPNSGHTRLQIQSRSSTRIAMHHRLEEK